MNDPVIRYFRLLMIIEGISLLALFFIAMPWRAYTGNHSPVRVVGMIHGILFLMFLYALVTIGSERKWGIKRMLIALIAASLPFGSFWFERKYLLGRESSDRTSNKT